MESQADDSDADGLEQLRADLGAAIGKVIAEHEGAAYLIKFIVLAEVVDADGARALYTVTADDMKAWDVLGLLEHARAVAWSGYPTE